MSCSDELAEYASTAPAVANASAPPTINHGASLPCDAATGTAGLAPTPEPLAMSEPCPGSSAEPDPPVKPVPGLVSSPDPAGETAPGLVSAPDPAELTNPSPVSLVSLPDPADLTNPGWVSLAQ